MSSAQRILLALVISSAVVLCSACRETPFELAHDQSAAQNPVGVELRIATIGSATTFRLPEPVKIEEFFTAKYPNQWHIELLEGLNQASVSDQAHVTNGQTSFAVGERYGVVCCDSKHGWLDLDPQRIPAGYTHGKTFVPVWIDKPGKYEFYVTTYRVFSRDQTMNTYEGLGYAVTSSNILKVEVTR